MKKILIGLFLGLSSFITQAAPTDCRQLVDDGEVDCIKATSSFRYASSNAPLRNTFEETVSDFETSWCTNYQSQFGPCYIQYENSPPEPPQGRIPGSGVVSGIPYTYIDYSKLQSSAGWVVATSYASDVKKYGNKYGKHQMVVYHFRVCPLGMTAVDVLDTTYSQRYCKPNPIPKNTPTSCDTSCNASSGNVSVGN